MIMRKRLITCLLLLAVKLSFGQTPSDDPRIAKVLPPSPEASALVSAGVESVSLFSGKAQASIPFYTIKLDEFTLPVGLQYNSGGLKINESPTKEGLGWSISGIGVVTRSVRGKPDDGSTIIRKTEPPAAIPGNPTTAEKKDFYDNVSGSGNYDAAADEFSVSAPGLALKFILDENDNVILQSYSNAKVTVARNSGRFSSVTVTNSSGIKYQFGGTGATENTISHNIGGNMSAFSSIATAFYLKQITLPTGKTISFTYQATSEVAASGITESITRWEENDIVASCNAGTGSHTPCPSNIPDYSSYFRKVDYATYSNFGITSIETSDGQHITFTYGDHEPNNDGYLYTTLNSVDVAAGDFQRTYHLNYHLPAVQPESNLSAVYYASRFRFFLTEVSYTMPINSYAETVKYKLDYNFFEGLPCMLSLSQDWLGYNNASGNSSLLPHVEGVDWGTYANADRSFHSENAIRGMLEKITLPTGGYEIFSYEPNTVAAQEHLPTTTISAGGQGSLNGVNIRGRYESSVFHIYYAQTVSFWLTGDVCHSGHIAAASGQLVSITTGAIMAEGTSNDGPQSILLPPGDYKLTVSIVPGCAGDINTQYDPNDANGMTWVGKDAGGVRVKSIESYDPVTERSSKKYYTYAEKSLLTKSSGETLLPDDPLGEASSSKTNLDGTPCQSINMILICPTKVLSSNTLVPGDIYGDHMMYEYVIESDDPQFKNGGIQHKFNTERFPLITTVLGNPIKNVPINSGERIRGEEIETQYLDKTLATVKKIESNYIIAPNYSQSYTSGFIRKKFDIPPTGVQVPAQTMEDEFDYTKTTYVSKWNQLHSKTVIEYANGTQINSATTYTYNELPNAAPVNIAPIKTETLNSKGETLTTEITYPTDNASDPVNATMITKNMVSAVLKTSLKRNNVFLKSNTTVFKNWNSNSFIMPELIKEKIQANAEEVRFRYYGYNSLANPSGVGKENDVVHSFAWGYGHLFPICEVTTNTDFNYTSFEETSHENIWYSVDPAKIVTSATDAVTGNKYYSSNNIYLTAVGSGDYTVTYWSDQTTGYTVMGNYPGWPKQLRSIVRGSKTWYLYEHLVDGSKITLTGSGCLDELRSYPAGATMKTLTYSPFVGVSSQCDENNNIRSFEYDGLQRLALVRDENRNIVKKICYNYAGQPENCGVQHFPNDEQSGWYTPTTCPPNNTANPVQYIVPQGTYTSTIDVAHANAQAIADVNAHGQAYANTHPSCTPIVCTELNCPGKCINGVCDPGTMGLIQRYRQKIDGVFVWFCDLRTCYSDNTYFDSIGDSCPSPVPALTTCP